MNSTHTNRLNKTLLLALLVCIATMLVLIVLLLQNNGTPESSSGMNEQERKVLYWVAPMDPSFRRNKPGLSPMGMDLVPVYDDPAQSQADVVISPSVEQNLGVRTAPVSRGDFSRSVSAAGFTSWDQSSLQRVHPRADGWLETFTIASEGDRVAKGQILYELFSPRLVSAQREYLTALQANNISLTRAAKDRLTALGFTQQQITRLQTSRSLRERLAYTAQRDSVVVSVNARQGSYVMPQTSIVTLASLDTIWIDVDIHETQAQWMQVGLPATATVQALPGQRLHGTVAHVYPVLDSMTRSVRLRLVFDNTNEQLKPNMFAQIRIQGTPRQQVVSVPREAVIRSELGARVIVAAGEGKFNVYPVQTGVVNHQRIEILSGLTGGEQVVTSGQFLLDSEANGEQAMARLVSQ